MKNTESLLLSKVLNERDFYSLSKYNIGLNDFNTAQTTYIFIRDYVQDNMQTPSIETVVSECQDFLYEPETIDTFKYLCESLKNHNAKVKAYKLLQEQTSDKFNELKGIEFIDWLYLQVDKIRLESDIHVNSGTNYATNGIERLNMYQQTKNNLTNNVIKTPFPTLNEWLNGGLDIEDFVLIMAYTNKGKSWLATLFGLTAFNNNNSVLHYSPEISKIKQIQRCDTLNGNFNNKQLSTGNLSAESQYLTYLKEFTREKQPNNYIIKTMEDLENGLSIDTIKADLETNKDVKMVIIDGFNLMEHKGKDGQRNNMTKTSRQLRKLFAKYKVVGVVVHHTPTSSERNADNDELIENRVVKAPLLTDYSETVAIVQDATTVLTFNQNDGVGALAVRKAKNDCIDNVLELQVNFNHGIIKEFDRSQDLGF